MRPLLWALICVLGIFESVLASSTCTEDYQVLQNTLVQRLDLGKGHCVVKVGPDRMPELIYRQHFFFESGKWMVFNSYGPGGASDTGARTFWFLPSTRLPNFQLDSAIEIQTSSAYFSLQFSPLKSHPVSSSTGTIQVDPKIERSNMGGIELIALRALYLDFGYMTGSDPAANQKGQVRLTDPKGQVCQLKNSQLLTYDRNGDYELKYKGAKLKSFLRSHCPHSDISLL